MRIVKDMTFTLVPMIIRKDGKNYIIEDTTHHEFYEMNRLCVEAIRMLEGGCSLGEVEVELKSRYPDEEVDMMDFAEQLFELGLVQAVDGEKVKETESTKNDGGFLWIRPQVARMLIPRWTVMAFFVLLMVNVSLFLINPSLFPHYQDLFIFDIMSINIVLWMIVTAFTVLFHELGHILAARAFELPTGLSIGHRLFFVVLETDLSRAWSLRKNERNVLYMAGMYMDQWLLFIALIGQLLFPSVFLFQLVVLDIFIRTVFQCCLYMKTDLYYVLENMTGCYNLMENGKEKLAKWLPFIRRDEHTEAFEGEESVITLYSFIYIVGVTLTLGVWIIYFVPQFLFALREVLPHLVTWNGDLYFWDAFLFVGQSFIMLSLLFYSWVKSYVKRSNRFSGYTHFN